MAFVLWRAGLAAILGAWVTAAEDETSLEGDESGPGPEDEPVYPAQVEAGGAYVSNKEAKAFYWRLQMRPVREGEMQAMLGASFENGWPNPFGKSAEDVASWLWNDLLASNPFGNYGVLVPWPEEDDDQLGHGGWVAYSRRQVCYITAKSFFGGTLWNYDSGLFRLMEMCQGACDFRASFATLLAACSADETLADGKQGPMILTAKANAAPEVSDVRALAENVILESSGLRICDYDAGAGDISNAETVPESGCVPRTASNPGVDFMTGGLEGQVTQDISASWFGGYLFDAKACGLGGGQDERLSVYFPEVTVLAYFLSRSMPYPQVRQPVWFLGARNFFKNLDGTARFDSPLVLSDLPVDDRDLETITLEGASYQIDRSRPVVVFMSESQGFFKETKHNLALARTNRLLGQRDMSTGKFAFEKQVRAWYRSMALDSYDEAIRPIFKKLSRSLGAGPWLAGLWWGDSQLGFLAAWLGQALAAHTWGQPLPLDYYLYADFTENPGNMCYLLPGEACEKCLETCQNPDPPASAYWMPDEAYFNGRPCVPDKSICGREGFDDVVGAFLGRSVAEAWREIEYKVATVMPGHCLKSCLVTDNTLYFHEPQCEMRFPLQFNTIQTKAAPGVSEERVAALGNFSRGISNGHTCLMRHRQSLADRRCAEFRISMQAKQSLSGEVPYVMESDLFTIPTSSLKPTL
ncbi:unnamed protein product [Symbiodinium microadriaticum]|nr:unnamed protein product [Symbiodinium microadriaticum]